MIRFHTYIIYFFTISILLFYSKLQACDVAFSLDSTSNQGIVHFSAEYAGENTTYFWDFGDGQYDHGQNISHTYLASGYYAASLVITTNDDCTNMLCQNLSVTNENDDNCELDNCVYPGDTNLDNSANIYDLFSIGMHYGDLGPERVDASSEWTAQPAQDWTINCINGNLKHTDCNGDGIINHLDLNSILSNYNNDYSYTSTPNPNPYAPTILLNFDDDSIVIDETNPGEMQVYMDVILGTADNPISDLYALAFSLDFSDDLIDPGSINIEYDAESFFCDTENMLSITKETEGGMFDLAFSRTNKMPISGFGRIARVNFTIIGDIIVNRNPENNELPLNVEATGIASINEYGQDLNFASHGDVVTFKISNSTSLKENNDNLFQISPNPTTGLVRMDFAENSVNEYRVYDAIGRVLIQQKVSYQGYQTIDLNHLPNGTYFIEALNDYQHSTKRIVLSK
jgi:PKD repeat protein